MDNTHLIKTKTDIADKFLLQQGFPKGYRYAYGEAVSSPMGE